MSLSQAAAEAASARQKALKETYAFVYELAEKPAPNDKEIRSRCTYCDEPGKNICGQCRTARYCSRGCQAKDWPVHKLLCDTLVEFKNKNRPTPNHVRGIMFPAEESKPKYVWVEQFEENSYFFPVIDRLLGPHARYSNMVNDMNDMLEQAGHKNIGHGLVMIGLNEALIQNVPINKSILSLGKPGQMRTWFGNHIIVGRAQNALGTRGLTVDDVDSRDFRHAVDFYQHYPLNPCVINPERYTLPTLPGLIIYCDSARNYLETLGLHSHMEEVKISQYLPEQVSDHIDQGNCAVSAKLKLRWCYRQYSPRLDWLQEEINGGALRNTDARHLVHKLWSPDNIGTVVIFDHSGSPVIPPHIKALNQFMDDRCLACDGHWTWGAIDRGAPFWHLSMTMEPFEAFWTC
ncbi:hypothetical protein F5B20DRAFT_592371 [Whalleya microplaca]|nr:hypothetical protein F5B20DRAFT_592371 [Whalleya microplaca]